MKGWNTSKYGRREHMENLIDRMDSGIGVCEKCKTARVYSFSKHYGNNNCPICGWNIEQLTNGQWDEHKKEYTIYFPYVFDCGIGSLKRTEYHINNLPAWARAAELDNGIKQKYPGKTYKVFDVSGMPVQKKNVV